MPADSRPLPLVYDELPAGSDLRREFGADGSVTITAPAGEPSGAARRAAAHSTGLSSAGLCGLMLLLLLWPALPVFESVRRLDAGLRALATVLFTLFCGGVFLLVWKVRYGKWLDLLVEARREAVVVHADRRRLLIEIAGPRGNHSFDLPADQIRRISIGGDQRRLAEPVSLVKLELADGSVIPLLAGRHRAELTWAAATLTEALAVPAAPDGTLSAEFSPR